MFWWYEILVVISQYKIKIEIYETVFYRERKEKIF